MKISDANEYIQTVAAIGAIVALLAVGYEIRKSNMIALRETLSTNWTNAQTFEQTNMESGIAEVRAKAMLDPDNLTLEDMINLDSYLTAFLYDYHHNYEVVVANGNSEFVPVILDELAEDVPLILGSSFSRAWYFENKYWIHPDLISAIDRGIENSPIGADLAYYRKIQASALALK